MSHCDAITKTLTAAGFTNVRAWEAVYGFAIQVQGMTPSGLHSGLGLTEIEAGVIDIPALMSSGGIHETDGYLRLRDMQREGFHARRSTGEE